MNKLTSNKKSKRTARRLVLLSLAVLFLSIPLGIAAQDFGLEYGTDLNLGTRDIREIIFSIIQIALGFVGLIFLIFIIYGGWLWMTSGGEAERVEKAQKTLRNGVIGLVIILASLTIVTFVMRALTGKWWQAPWQPSPVITTYGYGALGGGIVDSHYPAHGEPDIPRNTIIVITFKEAISLDSLIDTEHASFTEDPVDGTASGIINEQILIYKTADTATGALEPEDVRVAVNSNHKIYTFDPPNLGSATAETEYTVALLDEIYKESSGDKAFSDTDTLGYGYSWWFEVSTKFDHKPPQVESIFPFPDNDPDTYTTGAPEYSEGFIEVTGVPQVEVLAAVSDVTIPADLLAAVPPVPAAHVEGEYGGEYNSTVEVAVNQDAATAAVTWSGEMSWLDGDKQIVGREIYVSSDLTLVVDEVPIAGNGWEFSVTAAQEAETLRVDTQTFIFGSDIAVSTTLSTTAGNIVIAVNGASLDVTAAATDALVTLTALSPGPAGDDIRLSTTSDALDLTAMSGGAGATTSHVTADLPDQPRNAIVQINFSEPMLPQTISGVTEVYGSGTGHIGEIVEGTFGYIIVQYDYDNNGEFDIYENVPGEWKISNQYKTVEFFSSIGCLDITGEPLQNSCGDPLFCLPLNKKCGIVGGPSCDAGYEATHFMVRIKAAPLQTCDDSDDCQEDPYLVCATSGLVDICQDDGINLPIAASNPPEGVTDMVSNSLDGNKNGNAQGPRSQSDQEPYNENNPDATTQGDNYQWSFYINSDVDLVPPKATATYPEESEGTVDLTNPLSITFDKIMSSSTLKTGQDTKENPADPQEEIVMEFINLVDPSSQPVGYWVTKRGIDKPIVEGDPEGDGYADYTEAYINHTKFEKTMNYGARAGSGLRDIYQNCYKPSEGPECLGTLSDLTPSCCRGVPCENRCHPDTGLCE